MTARLHALIPAAGTGARMGSDIPKQYLDIAGHPVLWHTVQVFERNAAIATVTVVIAPNDALDLDWADCPKVRIQRVGGATRAQTVLAGLQAMAVAADDWVLVHDAARPCLDQASLDRLIAAAQADAVGGILAIPLSDTIKRAGEGGRISATVPRAGLWAAQTPQMFRVARLAEALMAAGDAVTDEASAMEFIGQAPLLVMGSPRNLKVTLPADLALAARYLAETHG
ncbi:MAG: 2-C-methyl-D-erythritol 4-phosphate cytidylyltransferase [Betaproteobacteria bacterium]|nr:MAG: 2-C-methyl-D-erythritol 4-phosphate cytidylyltransferase [Betaproteobacteria bacterium]